MGAAAPMQQKHMVSNLKLMKKSVHTLEEEVLTMFSSYEVQWRNFSGKQKKICTAHKNALKHERIHYKSLHIPIPEYDSFMNFLPCV
jgi:hypothetical protein